MHITLVCLEEWDLGLSSARRGGHTYTKEGIIWKELCALPPVAVPRAGAW